MAKEYTPETPARLERAAIRYLQRYPASSARLRRTLERRISRAEYRELPIDRGALEAKIDEIIEKFTARGLLNDTAYAHALASSLRRRGTARRGIIAKLRDKGLDSDLIAQAIEAADAALADDEEDCQDPELVAARRFARRRRFGPHRKTPEHRAERRDRDMAALGRQGFGYGVARQVIDEELPD